MRETRLRKGEKKEVLSASTDPVLADLWDNEQDAIYDNGTPGNETSRRSKRTTKKPLALPPTANTDDAQG